MKTTTKLKEKQNRDRNRNRTISEPTAEQIETYRAYPALDQNDSMQGLASFLAHRVVFQALGDTVLVAATERAWWQDAVLLAAEPAGTADQARAKIEALQPALDGRSWMIADDGLRAMSAMITAGVECERQRFGLHAPTRH